MPTALFWSVKDSLSSRGDVERIVAEVAQLLWSTLKLYCAVQVPTIQQCRETGLGHLEYLWGSKVKGKLYYDLINLLDEAAR